MTYTNRKWVLASYPQRMPVEENWRLEQSEITSPGDGQILARALYLSVDPYMRGRVSAKKGYTKGVDIGEVMTGGAVAEIIESNHPEWKVGDLIETFGFGWQEFALLDPNTITRVDPEIGPPHAWLSYLGMPGITAWCALNKVGKPRKGDTVVVSAASGAVGQVAGQIAKAAGCHTVAVASSDSKLDWCRKLGYDVGVNYRNSENLTQEIAEASPNGIDIYFDNTAGPIHDAAMKNLAMGARVIIVGTISLADKFNEPDIGERFLRQILIARAQVSGFLVFDYLDSYNEARQGLADLSNAGKFKFRTDFMDGIENMPSAFLKLLHSTNMGKQLVRTEFAQGLPE